MPGHQVWTLPKKPFKNIIKSWRRLFKNRRTGIAHNLETLCVPMVFAIFINTTATSKQLVGYLRLFSSYWWAVIQFSGSFHKGKTLVFKTPSPSDASTFYGCRVVSRESKKGLCETNARVIKHYNCYFITNFDLRLIKSRPPALMALIQMHWT